MVKLNRIFIGLLCSGVLAGCVTQQFDSSQKKMVVQNESTDNEIAMTRISLGLGYLKMGNTTQAKLNLEKAKRYSPNLIQVHTAFAHYYDSVSEPELAIQSYEKALSINSNDADTLNNYGVFLCKHEQFEASEKQFLKAIAVPSYLLVSKSYENLAICQLKAKQFEKAENYLDKAIFHSPSNASVLLQMARLQYIKADYKKAQTFLTRYEKATRRFSPEALALAVKIYNNQFDRRAAKNYAAMLVKMFPNSFESKQYLLNNLANIEADQLAQEYKLLQADKNRPKKRVVVLKPTTPLQEKPVVAVTQKAADKTPVAETQAEVENNAEPEVEKVTVTEEEIAKELANAQARKEEIENKAKDEQREITLPIHVVAKGDSLFSISKKYNIHMKAIERWNGISRKNVLKLGQILYLANPTKAAESQE